MVKRAVIIGMNDPRGGEPLSSRRAGSAGARLRAMLVSRVPGADYEAAFDRRNLVPGRKWNHVAARRRAARMRRGLRGRVVVLLGDEVRRAFNIPKLLLYPQVIDGVTWRQVPHPSGRCRWYNDERNRVVVEMLLEDLYTQWSVR